MERKVYKSGSSLVVVVPSEFVELVGIKKGDKVKVKADPSKGRLQYQFSGLKQLALSNNFVKKKRKTKKR